MKKLTKILMIAVIAIMASCTKEGPQGPAGTNGATGPAGPIGPEGPIGNANVMYSDWFDAGAWTTSTTGSEKFYFDRPEAKITQAILDNGVVLAYTKLISDGSNIRALPANTATSTFWNYILTVGNIRFTTNLASTPRPTNKFRYVIIPSTTHLRVAKPLTQMSYDEVCELYNIPK